MRTADHLMLSVIKFGSGLDLHAHRATGRRRVVILTCAVIWSICPYLVSVAQSTLPVGNEVSAADAERLRDIWTTQRIIVQTARIEASYGIWGMQEVSRAHIESFIAKLLPLIQSDPRKETVVSFFQREFPGKQKPWRDVVFTLKGKQSRERFDGSSQTTPTNRVSQETVHDGKYIAMYWSDSKQVSIFEGQSPWSQLGLKDFVIIPTDNLLEYNVVSILDNKLRLSKGDRSVIIDLPHGDLLEAMRPNAAIYQCAFQVFDRVSLPLVVVRVDYRKEMLYQFSVLLVQNAVFNSPVLDDFKLAVPAGTVVADMRRKDDTRTYRATSPIKDVVSWLLNNAPVKADLSRAKSDRPDRSLLIGLNVGAVVFIVGLVILRRRKAIG